MERRAGFVSNMVSVRTLGASSLGIALCAPVLAIFYLSLSTNDGLWPHLIETVIPRYFGTTLILMLGVGVLSLLLGVGTAWIISRYEFRYGAVLDVLLTVPIACPAYLVAYAYTDFFEYAGPLQSGLRDLMGWSSPQDYAFPEIRSMGGAIFVLSFVLYPYVFLMARSAFQMLPSSFYDVGALSSRNVFWTIALPLSRPAIIAGLALVLMEVISDFGTVEFFAVETLTLGIFNVWLGMDSIGGAAQIAASTFSLIILLLLLERHARGRRSFHDTARKHTFMGRRPVVGWRAFMFQLACFVPFGVGFLVPVSILAANAAVVQSAAVWGDVALIALRTLMLGLAGAALIGLTGLAMASVSNKRDLPALGVLAQVSSAGYAVPGTMLAIGVLGFIGWLDGFFAQFGLYLSGTIAVVLFAYIVRFQAVGFGAVASGLSKLSPSTVQASRSLGMGPYETTRRITLPLIAKPLAVGFVLAFVDISKELPMTLLLRPFDFETLATYAYQFAHSEQMELAAVPALVIIAIGVIPALLLNHFSKR